MCGAKRVFELQLLSTVLHVLDVDRVDQTNTAKNKEKEATANEEHTDETKHKDDNEKKRKKKNKKKKKNNKSSTQLHPEQRRRLMMSNGGMDWSTLLVYSCEDSCNKSCDEVAIVHPPL